MQNYVLLTGATGLLGQYLLRDLLLDGQRVAVVVRGSKHASPAQRVEQTMQMWERQAGRPLPRPVVLSGELTQANLGLNDEQQRWVRTHCDGMLHCAASLTFFEAKGEPWRTNVEGTRHVLDFCRTLGIGEMHYISTAYVCGHRHDLVREDELDVGQEFRNDYEESKFLAEKMVREESCFRSLTIYRPVVITGDSKTGYTSTYHGSYLYMKLARLLARNIDPDEHGRRHLPISWGLTGDERRNITPVDWNSSIICKLIATPEAHGRTYHLAPSQPITMREVIDHATTFYGITGIDFRGGGRRQPRNSLEDWLWANIAMYRDYDFMDPRFDCTNLRTYAPEPECPVIDYEFARVLVEYAEADEWGRRAKPPLIPPPLCVSSFLDQIVVAEKAEEAHAPAALPVGLDITGPGGGQWTMWIRGDRAVRVDTGLPLPGEDAPVLRMPISEFQALQSDGAKAVRRIDSGLPGGPDVNLNLDFREHLAAALRPAAQRLFAKST